MSIHAVARACGVSISTVSRVFNRPERVAAATRARVFDSARRLGFVPNESARTLRTQRSRTLGVVLPTFLNPVFAECLEGVAMAADAAGYAIVPLSTDYRTRRESEAIERLMARDVDGMIVTVANAARSASLRRLRATGVRHVLAHNRHADHACVSVDNEAAFAAAVRHLVELGHRRIAMASGTLAASDRARQRHRGFQAGLRAAGLPAGELIEMPFMRTAIEAVTARLARRGRPTALVCGNDLLAVRCIRAAHMAGLRVPDDLSVIGIDGVAIGDDLTPRLSSIVTPNRRIGEACVEILVRALREDRAVTREASVDLPFMLRHGETCGAVPGAAPDPVRATPFERKTR